MRDIYNDLGLLLLRLFSGGLMLTHGYPKMLKLFSGKPIQFADPMGLGAPVSLGLATFAEVICAFLLIIGVKTRLNAIPLAITMFVAAFIVHGADPFARKEKAILFLGTYLVLIITGGGRFSIRD